VKDDDGVSLLPERHTMTYLEVAHIIPHSLMSLTDIEGELQLVREHIVLYLESIAYNISRLGQNR
jgi:hypothetical protein